MKEFQLCGLGNAIVDIFLEVSEDEFKQLGFERGTMRLVDLNEQRILLQRHRHEEPKLVSGGSVAGGWKWSKIRCASFGVTFGTAASSATEVSRTRRAEPRVLRRLVRIEGPTPGIESSTDWIVRRVRSFLWYVIANRCASSRIRCSVWSAGDVGSRTSGCRLSA